MADLDPGWEHVLSSRGPSPTRPSKFISSTGSRSSSPPVAVRPGSPLQIPRRRSSYSHTSLAVLSAERSNSRSSNGSTTTTTTTTNTKPLFLPPGNGRTVHRDSATLPLHPPGRVQGLDRANRPVSGNASSGRNVSGGSADHLSSSGAAPSPRSQSQPPRRPYSLQTPSLQSPPLQSPSLHSLSSPQSLLSPQSLFASSSSSSSSSPQQHFPPSLIPVSTSRRTSTPSPTLSRSNTPSSSQRLSSSQQSLTSPSVTAPMPMFKKKSASNLLTAWQAAAENSPAAQLVDPHSFSRPDPDRKSVASSKSSINSDDHLHPHSSLTSSTSTTASSVMKQSQNLDDPLHSGGVVKKRPSMMKLTGSKKGNRSNDLPSLVDTDALQTAGPGGGHSPPSSIRSDASSQKESSNRKAFRDWGANMAKKTLRRFRADDRDGVGGVGGGSSSSSSKRKSAGPSLKDALSQRDDDSFNQSDLTGSMVGDIDDDSTGGFSQDSQVLSSKSPIVKTNTYDQPDFTGDGQAPPSPSIVRRPSQSSRHNLKLEEIGRREANHAAAAAAAASAGAAVAAAVTGAPPRPKNTKLDDIQQREEKDISSRVNAALRLEELKEANSKARNEPGRSLSFKDRKPSPAAPASTLLTQPAVIEEPVSGIAKPSTALERAASRASLGGSASFGARKSASGQSLRDKVGGGLDAPKGVSRAASTTALSSSDLAIRGKATELSVQPGVVAATAQRGAHRPLSRSVISSDNLAGAAAAGTENSVGAVVPSIDRATTAAAPSSIGAQLTRSTTPPSPALAQAFGFTQSLASIQSQVSNQPSVSIQPPAPTQLPPAFQPTGRPNSNFFLPTKAAPTTTTTTTPPPDEPDAAVDTAPSLSKSRIPAIPTKTSQPKLNRKLSSNFDRDSAPLPPETTITTISSSSGAQQTQPDAKSRPNRSSFRGVKRTKSSGRMDDDAAIRIEAENNLFAPDDVELHSDRGSMRAPSPAPIPESEDESDEEAIYLMGRSNDAFQPKKENYQPKPEQYQAQADFKSDCYNKSASQNDYTKTAEDSAPEDNADRALDKDATPRPKKKTRDFLAMTPTIMGAFKETPPAAAKNKVDGESADEEEERVFEPKRLDFRSKKSSPLSTGPTATAVAAAAAAAAAVASAAASAASAATTTTTTTTTTTDVDPLGPLLGATTSETVRRVPVQSRRALAADLFGSDRKIVRAVSDRKVASQSGAESDPEPSDSSTQAREAARAALKRRARSLSRRRSSIPSAHPPTLRDDLAALKLLHQVEDSGADTTLEEFEREDLMASFSSETFEKLVGHIDDDDEADMEMWEQVGREGSVRGRSVGARFSPSVRDRSLPVSVRDQSSPASVRSSPRSVRDRSSPASVRSSPGRSVRDQGSPSIRDRSASASIRDRSTSASVRDRSTFNIRDRSTSNVRDRSTSNVRGVPIKDSWREPDTDDIDTQEEAIARLARRLSTATLPGIRDAHRGLAMLEDQITSPERAAKAEAEKLEAKTEKSEKAKTERPEKVRTRSRSRSKSKAAKSKGSWLVTIGLVILMALAWYGAETAVCNRYCRPTTCESEMCVWEASDPTFGNALPVKLDEWITGGAAGDVYHRATDAVTDTWDRVFGRSEEDVVGKGFSSRRRVARRIRKLNATKREDGEQKERWRAWNLARQQREREVAEEARVRELLG